MTTDTRVFYGPHNCERCKKLIVKASFTEGGEEFDQPLGPIYPNTEWVRHNCAGQGPVPEGNAPPPHAVRPHTPGMVSPRRDPIEEACDDAKRTPSDRGTTA